MKRYLLVAILFCLAGIVLGGYLFSDTKPRSFFNVKECRLNCLSSEEVLGLLGSVLMQKFSGLLPLVEKETDKTLAIKHPFPRSDIHYVIIPKKDIKSVEEVSAEDIDYIIDAYATMGVLIKEQNLKDYKIVVNGPGFQTVGYLHFHLMSELPE